MRDRYSIRAPPTSRVIAVFTGMIGLVLLTIASRFVELIGAAAAAGILFSVTGMVDTSERSVRNVIAGFVFVLGVCAIGAAIGLGLTTDPEGSFLSGERAFSFILIVAVGAVTYSLAVLSTGADIGQTTRLLCINGSSLVAVPFLLFVLLLVIFQAVAGPLPWLEGVFSAVVTPRSPIQGLVTLFGLLGITTGSLALAIRRLPVRIIISKTNRPTLGPRLDRSTDWLLRISISALVTGALAFLLLPSLWESLAEALPASLEAGIVAVATATPVRLVLLSVTGVALVFTLIVAALSRTRPESVQQLQRLLAYGTVAFVAVGVSLVVGADRIVDLIITTIGANETITQLQADFGALPLLVGLFTGAVIVPTTLFLGGALCGRFGILTPRSAAPVVSAVGLIISVIAASRLSSFSVTYVIVAGLAFVVWDVGTYGLLLNLELNHGGRRIELVHAGAVVGVTVAGISAFYVVQWVTDAIALQGTLTTAVITLLGLILILAVERV